MARFEVGETVVMDQAVIDARTLVPRSVSTFTVTITDPDGTVVVSAQSMVNDSLGQYHYDYLIPLTAVLGIYEVLFIASSGARITRQRDSFEVHS